MIRRGETTPKGYRRAKLVTNKGGKKPVCQGENAWGKNGGPKLHQKVFRMRKPAGGPSITFETKKSKGGGGKSRKNKRGGG